MPYEVKTSDQCPDSKPWACLKSGTGEVMGCHETEEAAQAQMAALYAKEEGMMNSASPSEARAAIGAHSTATTEDDPGGPEAVADASNSADVLRYMHAFFARPRDAGEDAAPRQRGRRRGCPPEVDATGRCASAPEVRQRRAEAVRNQPGMIPCGAGRSQPFPGALRAKSVERDGQQYFKVEGYASVTERGYEMWDIFGPYTEVVDRAAFDETLTANPDVAFLVNHRGVTMARTTNGSLELSVDEEGLLSVAYLNPKRQDVRDLKLAIEDGDITEMSFAFVIEDGGWSEDMDVYRIRRVNLDRGDVSAVNYGANPHTSIAARSREIIDALEKLPAGAARVAMERLQHRGDVAPTPKPATGLDIGLVRAQLLADMEEDE